MMISNKIIAVIPALNEEATVGHVVLGTKRHVHEVIVIDDGSRDGTYQCAKEAGALVLRHEKPLGYSASLEDGLRTASTRGADILLTLDADGQHRFEDIPRLLAPILSGEADVVLGQRPKRTHFAEWIFALYTGIRFGIRDPLCGLKAYHRRVYDTVGHFDALDSIGTELFLRAVKKGFIVRSVPIELVARRDTSRFYRKRIRANLKIFRALLKILSL